MRIRRLHSWDVTPRKAREIQEKLSAQASTAWDGRRIRNIAAADVSFPDPETVLAAVVVVSYPDLKVIETGLKSGKCKFPYIPGLLAFREVPSLVAVLRKLRSKPDVMLCDAQGFAHPRKMGLATHIGILANIPSIGCAKSLLCGEYEEPGKKKGDFSYLRNESGEKIGAALRTRDSIRPVYVSIGHRINLKKAIEIVLVCTSKYRIPEPLRMAHRLAGGERIEVE